MMQYRKKVNKYTDIIPTSHDYTCFQQFDWLKGKFYTSINSVSKNLGTIFILLSLKFTIISIRQSFLHIDKIHNNTIYSYSVPVCVRPYLSFKNSLSVDHLCVCESVYMCAVSSNRFKA